MPNITERNFWILAGTFSGGICLMVAVPHAYWRYAAEGTIWLFTLVYWALTRPRRPL